MDRLPAQGRLPELDAVRVAATVLILAYHFIIECAAGGLPLPAAAPTLAAFGAETGIELFFLLSGASLVWSGAARRGLRRYYAGRALAIYPPFWVGFAALFLYGEVLHGNNAALPKWKLVFSLLGLDGYLLPLGPNFYKIGEWYLGCLLVLYLVFPLLAAAQRRRAANAAAGAVLTVLWCVWPFVCPAPWDAGHTALGRAFVFWLGMQLPALLRAPRRKTAVLAALYAAALALLLAGGPWPGQFPQGAPLFLALLLFALAALAGPALDRLPAAAAAALGWLSKQSYCVFLVHHVFLTLVLVPLALRLALPPAALFAPYAVLCFALGAVLRLVSAPVRRGLARLLRAA